MPRWAARLREPWRFKVIYGGRGSSKSWTVARHRLLQASTQPLQGLCARETQESLGDSVHRLLSNQIDEMGLPGWTVQRERIFHRSGSEITFAGIRTDPAKIKSAEGVDWCWIEEAESVSKASWDILIPTIRGRGPKYGNEYPGAEIDITFNPRNKTDPTYQRFIVNPPPNALVLKVNWRENPWFPEVLREEKDHLARVDPDAYMHVWEGEPTMRSDAQVLRGKWAIEAFDPLPGVWDGPYFGMDFGFSQDPTHAVEIWRHMNTLYVRREARGIQIDIDRYPELLMKFPDAVGRAIRCDSARPESVSYLKNHGYPLAVSARKWPGSIEDGVAWLRSHDRIVVHPECPAIAEECRLWAHKVDRLTGDILPDIMDAHNHGMDAVRYAMEPAISQRLPQALPADFKIPSRW